MQFCKNCFYPENHPLGITFDSNEVCSGCLIHQEKDTDIWDKKRKDLEKILREYKTDKAGTYDCIIPVSGGKDSFFITHTIKNDFGLNPLLVSYNRYYNTAGGIYNLEILRSLLGCDIICHTPNPQRLKKLIRLSLEAAGSIHWPYLAGSKTFPIQVAVQKKIPLIIWGAHQGVEQVGMFSHHHEVEMSRWYRDEHDLMGLTPEDIVPKEHGIEFSDLKPLLYPDDHQLLKNEIRGVYLGNYIRWDTKLQHEKMHKLYPVYRTQQSSTFDHYSDADCLIYNSLHDEIKFRKFGYSVIQDHVAREIRYGRITREEGVRLISQFSAKRDFREHPFLKLFDISCQEIFAAVDKHRDPKVWEQTEKGWKLRFQSQLLDHLTSTAEKLPTGAKYSSYIPDGLSGKDLDHRLLMRGGI